MKCTIEIQSAYDIGDTVLAEFEYNTYPNDGTYNITVLGKIKDIKFYKDQKFLYTIYGRIIKGRYLKEFKVFTDISENNITRIDPEVLGEIIIYDPFDKKEE